MRQILFAREEAQERPALLRNVIADGAAQHGIAGLKCVEHGALGDGHPDLDFDVAGDVRQRSEVWREYDSDRHLCLILLGSGVLRHSSDAFSVTPFLF